MKFNWFILGVCLGALVAIGAKPEPTLQVAVAQERQVFPAPPIHVLLASMPLHIRDTSKQVPAPRKKPNLALREAGLE